MNYRRIIGILIVPLYIQGGFSWNVAAEENIPPKITAVRFVEPKVHHGIDIEVIPVTDDPEGDFVEYQYRWFVNQLELLENNSPILAGTRFSKGDIISLWVVPKDSYGNGPIYYGSEFEIPNAPPEFISTPAMRITSTDFTYSALAVDPDGDKISYSLNSAPPGISIDAETGVIYGSIGRENIGEQMILVTAQDSDGATTRQEYILHLNLESE